jgi:hypothetical protein
LSLSQENKMRHKYYHKRIAPRLLSGDKRDNYTGGLPPEVKEGLYKIAEKEGKSVSWVLEQVIIDYFGLKKPKYKIPAVTKEEQAKAESKAIEMSLGKSNQVKHWSKKGVPLQELKMTRNPAKYKDYIAKWTVK